MNAHKDSIRVAIRRFESAYDSSYKRRKAFNSQTDLFGAIKQLPRYLDPKDQNIIIFLSDMLNYESKTVFNFEDSLNQAEDIDRFIGACHPIDLPGSTILVITGRQTISSEKYETVKNFWLRYFGLCGTTVIDYSSGSLTSLTTTLQQK